MKYAHWTATRRAWPVTMTPAPPGRRLRLPSARMSVGPGRFGDRPECAQHDHDVGGHRPVLDVVQVEADAVVPRQLRAAAHLPQPGDAGAHEQPATVLRRVVLDLRLDLRS